MSANEKTVDSKVDLKAKRQRSPGFPIIPIDEAINRVRAIFNQDKRAFTTSEAILSHLGYKAGAQRSGTAGRVIAALKQYGLLDEKSGQFRVSDLAFKILHLPDDSEERANLISEAALTPPLFQRVLAHYQGELPSDATLRSHLILNERFNPDSVDSFIRVLRETIVVANPSADDYTTGEPSEEAQQPPLGGKPMQQPPTPPANKGQIIPPVMPAGGGQKPLFQYSVPLSIQRDVNAQLVITGTSLKRRDLEVLAKKVNDLLDAFEEEEPEPQKKPTAAELADDVLPLGDEGAA